jgi:hypothetical protein
MKVRKPNVLKQVICEISNTRRKNIISIFEKNIENILKSKRIIKSNMIMIINYFYQNSYRL